MKAAAGSISVVAVIGSAEMGDEVAVFPAAADGLHQFDRDGPAQRSREDRLVREARALAVQVVGSGWPVARGRAVAEPAAVADMHDIALALDAEVLPVGGEELLHVAPAGLRNVLLELMAVEATTAARLHELLLRGGIELGVDGLEEVGELGRVFKIAERANR